MNEKKKGLGPVERALEQSLGRKQVAENPAGRPGAIQDAPVPSVGKGIGRSSVNANTISSDTKAIDRAFGQSQQAGKRY